MTIDEIKSIKEYLKAETEDYEPLMHWEFWKEKIGLLVDYAEESYRERNRSFVLKTYCELLEDKIIDMNGLHNEEGKLIQ